MDQVATLTELPELNRTTTVDYSRSRLLLISIAALYLEIVLIRWLGTEVKVFAFFQNLSLIVCFLGFGVGCYTSKKRGSLLPSIAATTIIVVSVGLPFQNWRIHLRVLSSAVAMSSDAQLWGPQLHMSRSDRFELILVSLLVVAGYMILLAIAMIPLGRWVGYYLSASPNSVSAYSINLAGSLVGIWLLAILAYFWLPPSYWFAAAFALILACRPFSWKSSLITVLLLALTLWGLRPSTHGLVLWSPYQKIEATPGDSGQYVINVNNETYMSIANVSPDYLAVHPDFAAQYKDSSYDSPFLFTSSLNRVLIVGSGAGNDVAAALRHGAAHVDAVEIDPLIASFGRRLHPEHPYSSERVDLINNDARNYMRECKQKYDVIIFALLDSHTEFSGYSNMRVDNYVYTRESLTEARRLLTKDGVLVIKFEVRAPHQWIGQRFYSMLNGVFGHPPVTYFAPPTGWLSPGSIFLESDSPLLFTKAAENSAYLADRPTIFPQTLAGAPQATTDDWPYVYNLGRFIPRAYLSISVIVLLMALYMIGPIVKPGQSSAWQFFLLGIGFLLMETQLISRLALYFGSTWLVNSIALTGILIVLLAANLYVRHQQPDRLGIYYALLCVMLAVDFSIPWSRLPGSGAVIGSLLCVAYCIPIFFSGVIFTESFRRKLGDNTAFGANMLGAVAGGLAQNLSFVFGIKALLLIAIAVYASAALVYLLKPLRMPVATPSILG
jgi:spermidine synthase